MKIKAYKLTQNMIFLHDLIKEKEYEIQSLSICNVYTNSSIQELFKKYEGLKDSFENDLVKTYPELNYYKTTLSKDKKYIYVNEYYNQEVNIIGEENA